VNSEQSLCWKVLALHRYGVIEVNKFETFLQFFSILNEIVVVYEKFRFQ